MARELEKCIIKDSNVTYAINPFFFKNDCSLSFLRKYIDRKYYIENNKVLKTYKGRGETLLVVDDSNHKAIIRHYWRGGLIGKILKDNFLIFSSSSRRALNEFDMLITMRKMGLPVPRPILARCEESALFVRNDIVVEEIPGATNVTRILVTRCLTDLEISKMGDALGKLFRAGVYHTDLNINNILIDGADNVWIIDFDKCYFRTVSLKIYKKMVSRLKRSFAKECEKHSITKWSNRDFEKLEGSIYSSFISKY